MTDEEVVEYYQALVEYFGDRLPSFEHEPKQFAMCVKLYKYYKERQPTL